MFFSLAQFSGSELNTQLENWLSQAELSYGPARGIIAVSLNHARAELSVDEKFSF